MLASALVVLTDVVVAMTFLRVGAHVGRRPVTPDAALASRAFALWWFAVGALLALAAFQAVLGLFDVLALPVHLVLAQAQTFAFVAAFFGLLFHIGYVYCGDRRVIFAAALLSAVFYAAVLHIAASAPPDGVVPTPVGVRFVYDGVPPAALGALATAFVLVLVGGSIAFSLLALHLPTGGPRARAGAMAFLFTVWVALAALDRTVDIATVAWGPHLLAATGLVVAAVVVAAYAPPAWMSRAPRVLAEAFARLPSDRS